MPTTNIIYYLLIILNFLTFPFLLKPGLIWQNYYLLSLLIVMTGYFFVALRKFPPALSDKMTRKDLCWSLFAAGLPTLLYFSNINDYSLWLDEYVQTIAIFRSYDLLEGVTHSQQPPVAYYWGHLGLVLFGLSELGSRFFSVVAGFLFLWVMFINLKKLTGDNLFCFLGTIFLGLNTWVVLYTVEARPYMVSLFYFSIFLYFLMGYLRSNQQKQSLFLILNLIFTGLLWLLSISMQPLLFISFLLAYCLLLFLSQRNKSYLYLAIGLACALILNIPILQIILSQSQSYLKIGSFDLAVYFSQVISTITSLKSPLLYNDYNYALYLLMFLVILTAFFATKKFRFLLINSFVFLIGFSLVVILAFNLKIINWYFSPRYLITIVPMFYLIFLFSLNLFFEKWPVLFKHLFLTGFLGFALLSYFLDKPAKTLRLDWRGLYAQIDKSSQTSTKAYLLSFRQPGSWSDEYFIASEFYPVRNASLPGMSDYQFPLKMTNDFLFSDFASGKEIKEIYFAINRVTMDQQLFDKLIIASSEKFYLSDFYLIKVSSPDGVLGAAKSFYQKLELIFPEAPQKHRVYDGLFLTSLFEKNCSAMLNYYTKEALAAKEYGDVYHVRLEGHAEKIRRLCNEPAPEWNK